MWYEEISLEFLLFSKDTYNMCYAQLQDCKMTFP